MRFHAAMRLLLVLAAAALAGCASVATDVTVFDQAQKFPPTDYAAILLDYPDQPYVKVALIEALPLTSTERAGNRVLPMTMVAEMSKFRRSFA